MRGEPCPAAVRRSTQTRILEFIVPITASLLALVLSISPQAAPAAGQPGGQPPAGPIPTDPWPAWPIPPLERVKPRGYTIGYAIDVGATSQLPQVADPFTSTGGTITFEPAVADNWTVADLDQRQVTVRLNGSPVRSPSRLEGDPAGDQRRLIIDIPDGVVNAVSVRVTWPAIAFNSVVDERIAAGIAWPREWPAESRRFLSPSFAIDSDNMIFKEYVARVAGSELRRVPVYLAAKDLVRHAITEFRNVNGTVVVREGLGAVRGFRLQNASQAALSRNGSPGDLVSTCVAVLRAAGIPARPVIGISSGDAEPGETKQPLKQTAFCVWGEFHLPGAGWVPFDPWEMRGTGLPQANVHRPWKWFGTCDQLNRRVALAYDFAPVRQGFIQDWPAGWAWTISGSVRAPFRIVDATAPLLISRGPVRP